MASLIEAQAFLDQFDKCLPLCHRGDAVTVINALHTLNNITQASISQVKELDPSNGSDYFSSFLLELELALELYIAPNPKLGRIDGGLPALYSFSEEDLASLSVLPSVSTKSKVKKFLEALGVQPSPGIEHRGVAAVVREFLCCQVKQPQGSSSEIDVGKGRGGLVSEHDVHSIAVPVKSISVSWADQCNNSNATESDLDDMPPLEDGDSDSVTSSKASSVGPATPREEDKSSQARPEDGYENGGYVREDGEGKDVDDDSFPLRDEAAYTFLFSQPVYRHGDYYDDHDAPMGLSKPSPEEGYGLSGKARASNTRADQFYKTRICKNWEQTGSCQYGARCNFAHGDDEMRANPSLPGWSATAASARPSTRRQQEPPEETDPRAAPLYKTRMCKNYELSGACKFGDRCIFAHGKEELRRGSGGLSAVASSAACNSAACKASGGFKKRLCERFSSGSCFYGARCTFAHGPEDLL